MMLRAAFVPPAEAVEELRALAGRLGVLPGVHPMPTDRLDVRVAGMGNIGAGDVRTLARKIEDWAGVDGLPEVRWSGVRVEPNGDIGVGLDGDLDALADVARAVGMCAEKVHVFVDRRTFKPMVVLATMDQQQQGSRVAPALAGLHDWGGGDSWIVDEIALIRIRWFAGQAVSEVVEWIPIPTRDVVECEQV